MENIKFRIWDNSKTMYQWDEILTVHVRTAFQKVNGFHVMQFIGVCDKNEKEIYEGDVVRTHRFIQVLGENYGVCEGEEINICVVKYLSTNACFIFVPTWEHDEENYFTPWDFSDEGMEVIGNIYENPELLQEATKC